MSTHRHLTTFHHGLANEVIWSTYVDYETGAPELEYIAETHCFSRVVGCEENCTECPMDGQCCWMQTNYATEALALVGLNSRIVGLLHCIPDAEAQVTCHPEDANETVLDITTSNTAYDIMVVSGDGVSSNGVGDTYLDTLGHMWDGVETY